MNGLLKVLVKHKTLTLVTCVIIIFGGSPVILGILCIIWLSKLLNDYEGKK